MTDYGRIVTACGLVLLAAVSSASAEVLAKSARFPDWELSDQTGKERSAAELAGNPYLLWFYPRASTPGCTAEGRGFRDAYAEISRAGLTVLGVSFDAPATNAEFARAEEFPFSLLSDTERKLAIAVGAASALDQAYARRISYLVGPDGTVLVAYDDVDPQGHAEQVLTDFRASSANERPRQ